MTPEIYEGFYIEIETTHGHTFLPLDLFFTNRDYAEAILTTCDDDYIARRFSDYVEGEIIGRPELKEGVLARMSMPGYLDCTDWSAHDSEEEALAHLADMYGEDECT